MHGVERILCCGFTPCLQRTLEFEALVPGEVNRVRQLHVHTGGKQVNAARVIATLGGRPLMTGFCGGPDGVRLKNLLCDEGLDFVFTETAGNTRTCQTLIDRRGGAVTELVEESAGLDAVDWLAFEKDFGTALEECRYAAMSGTLPPGAPADMYARLIRHARERGIQVVLDTHLDPLLKALHEQPLLVKLNAEELRRTTGEKPDTGAVLLLQSGARNVLVTDGAKAVMLFSEQGSWRIRPPKVNCLNPIGSGDALGGGIMLALMRGAGLPEAVRFGVACAAAQTETLLSGTVVPERVAELSEKTEIEKERR